MIIFYNKKTGDIIGTVDGRIHIKDVIRNSWIQPNNVLKEDVGKYIVPFAPVYEIVERTIDRAILVDKKQQLYRKETVKEKVKVVKELKPDVVFASDIYDFEKRTKNILNYRVKLDKDGNILGFKKKNK